MGTRFAYKSVTQIHNDLMFLFPSVSILIKSDQLFEIKDCFDERKKKIITSCKITLFLKKFKSIFVRCWDLKSAHL